MGKRILMESNLVAKGDEWMAHCNPPKRKPKNGSPKTIAILNKQDVFFGISPQIHYQKPYRFLPSLLYAPYSKPLPPLTQYPCFYREALAIFNPLACPCCRRCFIDVFGRVKAAARG
jgi:hypothetical protein